MGSVVDVSERAGEHDVYDHEVYDIVGVGFGPSGLSLATAVAEQREREGGSPTGAATDDAVGPLTAMFFERSDRFAWHRNMLLPGAKLQVSFLKDLVTFRNPTSPFTFVAYLHAKGRLARFVNNGDFFPTRREFHDYLEWVESRVCDQVEYGTTVCAVDRTCDESGETVFAVDVESADAPGHGRRRVLARNVVVSTGLVPRMPAGIERSAAVWHSSEFLARFRAADPSRLRRVAVAGAGQSAAEITRFLYDELPSAEIVAIVPSYGYAIADNTPFANEVFDPEAVDDHFFGGDAARHAFWKYHSNTNYAVVDDEVSRDLYRRVYDDDIAGIRRLEFLRLARVIAARPTDDDRLRLTIRSEREGQPERLDVDALVCGTGYEPMQPTAVLHPLAERLARDSVGRLCVERDHRVTADLDTAGGLYLQGGTEHSHGLSASLLSNIAVRSGEIVSSVLARRADVQRQAVGAGAAPST